MFKVEILLIVGGAINDPLHESKVVRMHSLNYQFDRGLDVGVISENSKALLGPEYLSA